MLAVHHINEVLILKKISLRGYVHVYDLRHYCTTFITTM